METVMRKVNPYTVLAEENRRHLRNLKATVFFYGLVSVFMICFYALWVWAWLVFYPRRDLMMALNICFAICFFTLNWLSIFTQYNLAFPFIGFFSAKSNYRYQKALYMIINE